MKRSGPKIDPCGTPRIISNSSVFLLLSLVSKLKYCFMYYILCKKPGLFLVKKEFCRLHQKKKVEN